MDLKEIQNRNYMATVNRGLIDEETTSLEFIEKLEEELNELMLATPINEHLELADIIIVCLNYAEHAGINIQKALEEKTIFNEQRKD